MIFLNQIKNTRYLIQVKFHSDLTFRLDASVMFKFYENGNKNIPIMLKNKYVNSITVNGSKQPVQLKKNNKILISVHKLNNYSENIVSLSYKGKTDRDLIIISQASKLTRGFSYHSNILNLKLPSFNYYTYDQKYRLFITTPKNWDIFNRYDPFQLIQSGENKISCFESNEPNAVQNLNFSIKTDKMEWKHLNEYFQ